jgi:hypothetical protein
MLQGKAILCSIANCHGIVCMEQYIWSKILCNIYMLFHWTEIIHIYRISQTIIPAATRGVSSSKIKNNTNLKVNVYLFIQDYYYIITFVY